MTVALALTLAAAAPQAAPAQTPAFAQQGAVGMVPPSSMREAPGFTGFADAATGASITIAELPAAAGPDMARRLGAGGALPNGLVFSGGAQTITLAGGTPARLYRGTQTTPQGDYGKWMLLVDGPGLTAMVTAQVPAAHVARLRPEIEAALRSVTLRPPRSAEQALAALPFAIGDRAGFRLVRTLMGSGALLTDGPRDSDPGAVQPMVVIAASLGEVPVTDRADTARRAFADLAGFSDMRATAERPGADTSSYRIAGTARSGDTPVTVIQHMRYGQAGGYIRTVCTAPRGTDIAARCDRLAASIRAK